LKTEKANFFDAKLHCLVYIILSYVLNSGIIATEACPLTAQLCTVNTPARGRGWLKIPLIFNSFAHFAQGFAQPDLCRKIAWSVYAVYIMRFQQICGIVQLPKPLCPPCLSFRFHSPRPFSVLGCLQKIICIFMKKTIDFMDFPRYNVFLREEKTNGLQIITV